MIAAPVRPTDYQEWTPEKKALELHKCAESPTYFIYHYVKIFDATSGLWIPFQLWYEQSDILGKMDKNRKVIVLKARQLGLSWLVLAYFLHQMMFKPVFTCGVFSKTETDSIYLIGPERLRGMYKHLPDFLKFDSNEIFEADSAKTWIMPNGSSARAFAVRGGSGDGYTFSGVLIDEASLCPDLALLLRSVEPTISGGGKLIQISRANKDASVSAFNNIFHAALRGENDYVPVFLPWWTRPERDKAWYFEQKADSLSVDGTTDALWEQYPGSIQEALAPKVMGKRFQFSKLQAVYEESEPIAVIGQYDGNIAELPDIPGLRVYRPPQDDETYVIGADSAEGNPNSDFSTFVVFSESDGGEVTTFRDRVEPSVLGDYIIKAAKWYNDAGTLPERNNHGHATIQWIDSNSEIEILLGQNERPGWLNNKQGKIIIYDHLVDTVAEQGVIIRDMDTFNELAALEGNLQAPTGLHDDLADAAALGVYAIGMAGRKWRDIPFLQAKMEG
jgi:hypothetical protein